MNCFNHPEKYAVGICKACNRGLCAECAADLGHGIACKNSHEAEVEHLNRIIQRSAKLYSATSGSMMVMPFFYLFLGLLFAGFGFFMKGGVTDLPFLLGVGFIVMSVYMFYRARLLYRKTKN